MKTQTINVNGKEIQLGEDHYENLMANVEELLNSNDDILTIGQGIESAFKSLNNELQRNVDLTNPAEIALVTKQQEKNNQLKNQISAVVLIAIKEFLQ